MSRPACQAGKPLLEAEVMAPEIVDEYGRNNQRNNEEPFKGGTLQAEKVVPGLKGGHRRFTQKKGQEDHAPEQEISGVSQKKLAFGYRPDHAAALSPAQPFPCAKLQCNWMWQLRILRPDVL